MRWTYLTITNKYYPLRESLSISVSMPPPPSQPSPVEPQALINTSSISSLHIVHFVGRIVVFNGAEAAETVSEEVALKRSERGDQDVEAKVVLAATHQVRVVDVPTEVSRSLLKPEP